jgi:hypothetical protein
MALSEEANRIMSSAREAYSPAHADKARNRKALALRIAVGTSAITSVATGSVISSAASKFILVGLAATTAVGTVAYEWTSTPADHVQHASRADSGKNRSHGAKLVERSGPASGASETQPARKASNEPPASVAAAREKPRTAAATPNAEPKPDVGAELALLREARRALSSGDPGRALELTDAHARAFPRGALSEERSATRIVALCSLGRGAEGRKEAQRFLERAPDSPLAERVRTACSSSEREP